MTTTTRKTSNYSVRLKRAEKKKVGYRQGRIIDIDGFLVFPEEMKQIRKASKLPVRAVEPVTSRAVTVTFSTHDIPSADFWITNAQFWHDDRFCDSGECVTIGFQSLFKDLYNMSSLSDTFEQSYLSEIVEALSHETFHHIFGQMFPLYRQSQIHSYVSTVEDTKFDERFNPFQRYVDAFSTNDTFRKTVGVGPY